MAYRMKNRVVLSDAGLGPAVVGVLLIVLIEGLAVSNGMGHRDKKSVTPARKTTKTPARNR
jgi:hypothetical protein